MNRLLPTPGALAQAVLMSLLVAAILHFGRKALLKWQIGADAYSALGALQPGVTAPVIRVGAPASLPF